MLAISIRFADAAYDSADTMLDHLRGFSAALTLADGSMIEHAVILGAERDAQEADDAIEGATYVEFVEVPTDPETGRSADALIPEAYPPEARRVEAVKTIAIL